jgi:hypothetical protein
MLQYARHTLAVGSTCLALFVLSSCEPNTAPTSNRIGKATSPGLAKDDAPENASIIVGTGDPSIDVAAVQAAVDRGGAVILKGRFSFDAPPSSNNRLAPDLLPLGLPPSAEVKIKNAVTISGVDDERGGMTAIDGGTIPFYVEAPGQAVTIRRLRFVRPTSHAVLVFAARGLEITANRVEGLAVFSPTLNGAISILTGGAIPSPTKPGKPGNVSGNLVIAHNDFDLAGGTSTDNVLGVTVFSVGDSSTFADVGVSENRIVNTTEPAINFRRVVGRVSIDHNVLKTGTVGVANARSQVIRVANLGSYLIAHNVIDCEWTQVADAQGIGVFSQFAAWPIEHVRLVDNHVAMVPSPGTTFTDFSAAIGVYGFANDNLVRRNHVRGRARAGVSIPVFPLPPQAPAAPSNNSFVENRFEHFAPAVADFFVGEHALGTQIIGPGTVDDQGSGTIVVQSPRKHAHR